MDFNNNNENGEPISEVVGDLVITSFPDGSSSIEPYVEHHPELQRHHKENLALFLDEGELREIGANLKEAIEDDIDSQAPFFEATGNIIEMMGLDLDNQSINDLPFEGASSVYSSTLFETLQMLSATITGVIFKTSGMVDTVVRGNPTEQLYDIASRKKDWFNDYFENVYQEFRKTCLESNLWTFLVGANAKKVHICPILNMPISEAIPVEDFIVNNAYSYRTAPRKTHRIKFSEKEFKTRLLMGIYRDVNVAKQDEGDSDSDNVVSERLNRQIGHEPTNSRMDGQYVLFEAHDDLYIKGDPQAHKNGLPSPYIVSLDAQSGQVLKISRNWKEGDKKRKRIEYFADYYMLPALRGQGYGLLHYGGRLAEAATALLRQLINALIYSNFPGGVYQQGVKLDNNNISPSPGEFIPLMCAGSIKDAIQPFPYKDPNPLFNDILKDLQGSISKPVALIDQKISEIPANAPVGTTRMIFDQLHKLPSLIMQNFYECFSWELKLYNDLFAECLEPGRPYPFKVAGGDRVIMREDFEADVNVIPSADPVSKNSAHRFIDSEIVLNTAKESPDIVNKRYATELFFKNLNIPPEDIEKLLTPPKSDPPKPMDAVSTMMAIIKGEPVTAAVWQNHDAYIAILNSWIQMNPQDPHIQNAMALKTQYEAYKYMVDVYASLGLQPPQDPSQLSPDEQNQLAVQVAHLKMQELQQAQAQAAQQQGPSPMDLAQVELESAKLQAQIQHERNEIELRKVEVNEKKIEMDHQLSVQEFDLKMKIQHLQAERESFKIAHDQAIKERDQALKEKEAAIEEMQHQVEQVQRQEQLMEGVHQ